MPFNASNKLTNDKITYNGNFNDNQKENKPKVFIIYINLKFLINN